jgi:hypothetical protein
MTGNPVKAGEMTNKGFVCHVGSYMVESSYNHYSLVQIVNSGGGHAVLTTGTKSDIVDFISAYVRGWSDAKQEGK